MQIMTRIVVSIHGIKPKSANDQTIQKCFSNVARFKELRSLKNTLNQIHYKANNFLSKKSQVNTNNFFITVLASVAQIV